MDQKRRDGGYSLTSSYNGTGFRCSKTDNIRLQLAGGLCRILHYTIIYFLILIISFVANEATVRQAAAVLFC